jgi:hypothetical protein
MDETEFELKGMKLGDLHKLSTKLVTTYGTEATLEEVWREKKIFYEVKPKEKKNG